MRSRAPKCYLQEGRNGLHDVAQWLFGSAMKVKITPLIKKREKCHREIKIYFCDIVNYKNIIDVIEVIETCFIFK